MFSPSGFPVRELPGELRWFIRYTLPPEGGLLLLLSGYFSLGLGDNVAGVLWVVITNWCFFGVNLRRWWCFCIFLGERLD